MYIYARVREFCYLETANGNRREGEILRESRVEQALVKEVKKRNGMTMKFVSPGLNGVPDRLLLFPGGRIAFVEVKAPGKKMRPLQIKRAKQLRAFGVRVYCVDEIEKIGGMLDEIQTTSLPEICNRVHD